MKRGGPLKRKTPMKRTAMKCRPRRPAPDAPGSNRAAFMKATKAQRVCAVCGDPTAKYDPHHVIERQYLKQNHHPQFHPDNSLRVCDRFSKKDCHGGHTSRMRKIKTTELRPENIRYAFYLLGPYAYDYLRRHYAGEDPRLERALAEAEAT